LRLILCATPSDEERFCALGAAADHVHLTGSLKVDAAAQVQKLSDAEREELRQELGFGANAKTIVLLGSSTWAGEEALLLAVQQAALAAGLDVRLLLVPRHAERRGEIMELLKKQSLPWHARSTGARPPQAVKIYLGDTTGELSRLTQAADVAFIGKSLPPHEGGQTPIEAAALGVPLVYGPRMSNFRDICRSLEQAGAALRVQDAATAQKELLGLLQDAALRAKMSATGRNWHTANQGATQRTAEALEKLLG
jgi:3-deoxy-D-manno-octulosonic-acid transferase